MLITLKPCPFCGSTPEICGGLGYDQKQVSHGGCCFSIVGYHVECFKCLAKTKSYKTLEQAKDAWNNGEIEGYRLL